MSYTEKLDAATEALIDSAMAQMRHSVVCPPVFPRHCRADIGEAVHITVCPQCGYRHAVGTEHPNWRMR